MARVMLVDGVDTEQVQPDQDHQPAQDGHADWRRRLHLNGSNRLVFLLLLLFLLDYADRGLIGAMGPTLKSSFGMNNTQLGLLVTANNLVGAFAALPVGALVDRVNRTNVLAAALALWVGATTLVGASVSYLMLVLSRLALGALTAVSGPATPSLIGDAVAAGRRARALGYVQIGELAGTGLGLLLAAVVTSFLTFRWGFWLLGAVGVAVAVAFLRVGEPPRRESAEHGKGDRKSRVRRLIEQRSIQPSPPAVLHEDPREMSLVDAARYVLRVRTDAIVLFARSIGDYFFAAVTTFAVIFAAEQYRVSAQLADVALFAVGAGALTGVLVMGRLADALLARGVINSRLWVGAAGYGLSPFALLPALLVDRLWLALPFILIAAFLLAGAAPAVDAVRVDVLVPRLRGRGESVREVMRTAAEGGAPLILGVLSSVLAGGGRAGLQWAFLVTLPALFLSGVILLFATHWYGPDVAAAIESSGNDSHT